MVKGSFCYFIIYLFPSYLHRSIKWKKIVSDVAIL